MNLIPNQKKVYMKIIPILLLATPLLVNAETYDCSYEMHGNYPQPGAIEFKTLFERVGNGFVSHTRFGKTSEIILAETEGNIILGTGEYFPNKNALVSLTFIDKDTGEYVYYSPMLSEIKDKTSVSASIGKCKIK
jgi:hypothetical protein